MIKIGVTFSNNDCNNVGFRNYEGCLVAKSCTFGHSENLMQFLHKEFTEQIDLAFVEIFLYRIPNAPATPNTAKTNTLPALLMKSRRLFVFMLLFPFSEKYELVFF